MTLSASPAYNRDYTTPDEVREAWNKGRDFHLDSAPGHWVGGPYFSVRNAPTLRGWGYRWVAVRHKCNSAVCVIQL